MEQETPYSQFEILYSATLELDKLKIQLIVCSENVKVMKRVNTSVWS